MLDPAISDATFPSQTAATARWCDRAVWAFVFMDLLLGALYLGNYALHEPYWSITIWVNLNREGNLPSYYSAMQLFLTGMLLSVFAWQRATQTHRATWALWLLPALVFYMSLDEGSHVHEPIGQAASTLVLGLKGRTAWRLTTGWMVVLGPPFALAAAGIFLGVRRQMTCAPGVLSRLALGLCVLLLGALGVESLSNITGTTRTQRVLMIYLEETLEMLGGTIMLWAAMGLLASQGFRVVMRQRPADPW